MPFGLTNASTAFQRFMNNIFSDLLDVCVMIYLDDILIYSNNMSEHHWHVKKVLKRLCKAGLYTKAEKCKFYSKLVEYLGYILSPSGLIMSDDKIKIIQDWLEPKKVTVELNYDTHDKELLTIFEAFKIWQHYLEGPAYSIDIVMDHKNLEYFSTTKVLTQRQTRWSEYLSQFNLVIRFHPGHLSTKPDALTR